jgi:protoporphyrinogen oxidase
MTIDADTIIIGAGPAGLAAGAVLRRGNVPFVLLERAEHVGASWHTHYDRLHLHTPKRHSALPYRAYPRSYPRYPSRQQVLDYLDDYARAFDLQPEFGRKRNAARALTTAHGKSQRTPEPIAVVASLSRPATIACPTRLVGPDRIPSRDASFTVATSPAVRRSAAVVCSSSGSGTQVRRSPSTSPNTACTVRSQCADQ